MLATAPGSAQEPSAEDLAKQLSNPVASLVSIPFQFNWDQPVGIDDDYRMIYNFQPVIPLTLSDDWNLIVRWIMPYISQPRLAQGAGPVSGLGDIVASMFLSPTESGAFTWGVGPVVVLPGSSDPLLGSGKWGIGPTGVILQQRGPWTYGALANHVISFAGDDFTGGAERGDVNATFLQPFVSFTTANAVTFGANMEAAANWEADDEWTVPLHVTVTKLTSFGPFPFSIGGGVGYFLAAPGDEPDWRLRVLGTVLLPRSG
ncbi:MAG: transporter [Gemmatimonadota bacterium]